MFSIERGRREPEENIPQQESSTGKKLEAEKNPEAEEDNAVAMALEEVERKDDTYSPGWREKGKEFFKTPGGKALKYAGFGAGMAASGLFVWIFKDIYAIWKFAQKFIEKRGNMTYADGRKIADDIFSAVGGKKEKA